MTKKYLTIELFQKLCELKTTPTIIDCIKKSTLFDFNLIGVVPLDAKCYTNFAIIFNSIIADYNCVASEVKQPVCTWGDWNEFEKIDDPSIISIKMSCRRTIDDYPFVLGMNEQQFEDVLTKVTEKTNKIQDIFAKNTLYSFFRFKMSFKRITLMTKKLMVRFIK